MVIKIAEFIVRLLSSFNINNNKIMNYFSKKKPKDDRKRPGLAKYMLSQYSKYVCH